MRKIVVVVFALRRSVSFFDAINWNLADKRTAFVGADALIGPQENVSDFSGIPANSTIVPRADEGIGPYISVANHS